MILAIAGKAGTGKSTLGKLLAKEFNCRFRCVGDWFRAEAEERGMKSHDLELLAETDLSVDINLDMRTLDFGRECTFGLEVIDGRRVPFVLREAEQRGELNTELLTILMTCGDDRFRRMAQDPKRPLVPVDVMRQRTLEREEVTSRRYKRQYDMTLDQILDPQLMVGGRKVYDLHFDTNPGKMDENDCLHMVRAALQAERV